MIPSTVLHALHEALIHFAAFSMHRFLELHVFVSHRWARGCPMYSLPKPGSPKTKRQGSTRVQTSNDQIISQSCVS